MTFKKCSTCKEFVMTERFHFSNRSGSLVARCKCCVAKIKREKNKLENPEFHARKERFKSTCKENTVCRLCEKEFTRIEGSKEYRCKPCNRTRSRLIYIDNKEAVNKRSMDYRSLNRDRFDRASRASALRINFGLTFDCLDKMKIMAGNACEICHIEFSKDKPIQIDHNHATGIVRGLLCRHCNTAIGLLRSDVTTHNLSSAIDYIKRTETYL